MRKKKPAKYKESIKRKPIAEQKEISEIMIDAYQGLKKKVEELEKDNISNFRQVFAAIKILVEKDKVPKSKIGFKVK